MIHARPKIQTLLSVGLVLLIVLAVDVWLFIELLSHPEDYFFFMLFLIPTLLVIGIIIASKSIQSSIDLKLGDNKLTYKTLFGSQQVVAIKAINYWQEDVIQRKRNDYRRLEIALDNGKKLHISNHEQSDYQKVVNYLSKKLPKQRKK